MSSLPSSRYFAVDALRGFALTGIVLLHAIEHFDLLLYPDPAQGLLGHIDTVIYKTLFFIFAGKAYSIFSILFGLSFYLQMQKQAERGIDFRGRFLWRLVLLLIMGYLLSLIYIGEILSAFALLGVLLLALDLIPNRWLVMLAVLLLIQAPTLFLLRLSFAQPDFSFSQDWSAWEKVSSTFSQGSLAEVIRFNAYQGHLAKWQFFLNSGRYLQLIGLFIIGLLLGRWQYFKKTDTYHSQTVKAALISATLFVLAFAGSFLIKGHFNPTQETLMLTLCDSYSNLFFTVLLFTSFLLLLREWDLQHRNSWMASYGKMSLSNYILQPLIGVPFFYGFGWGMYQYFGVTYSFLFGIALLILQLVFSSVWMKHFQYGPFEWLWRALTFGDVRIPNKK